MTLLSIVEINSETHVVSTDQPILRVSRAYREFSIFSYWREKKKENKREKVR